MPLDKPRCYEFPPFRLDVHGKRLFHNNNYVHLTTRAVEILTTLVAASTNVVLKDELMSAVWPNSFVEEANISNLIGEIRSTLRSLGDYESYVKTYQKRGYCFEVAATPCNGEHNGQPVERPFERDGFFNDFRVQFDELLRGSGDAELFFIHSRRWRMNHHEALVEFLKCRSSLLTIYLPNLQNRRLLNSFKLNFNEGKTIEDLIRLAYRDFAQMHFEYSGRVIIRPFDYYPGYSFYRFENKLIIAMYPNTPGIRGVPTFLIEEGSKYWSFFLQDLETLRTTVPLSESELRSFIE
jgi:DNA-binding winged helix-turn-helix (wHTH) protein